MPSRAESSGGSSVDAHHAHVLTRIGWNSGWLMGSIGFSAIVSLVYVALTARTLGPRAFGNFALIMTYGELIATLVQFQTWRAIGSFGAMHQKAGDKVRLGRLLGYSASLDAATAVFGSVAGFAGMLAIGPLLHWSPREQSWAAWFCVAMLVTTGTTPAGMLRLFGRFDLQAYSEAFAQFTRLLGCAVGWAIGASGTWFLCVWPLAALLELVLQWSAVLWLGLRPSFGTRAVTLAGLENPGLWSFIMKSSISNSLNLVLAQMGTLVVGMRAGPVEAGGFRLAYRFSQAMMKPVEIAAKALLPELGRLVVAGRGATTRHLLARLTWISAGFACVIVLASLFAGREVLRLIAGPRFEFASNYLVLLCIAAAINVAGFGFEPLHNAHLRQGTVLRAYAVAAVLYGLVLVALFPAFGAYAAALASIVAALACVCQLAISAQRILRHDDKEEIAPGSRQAERSLY